MATFFLGASIDPIKTIEFWRDNLDRFEFSRDKDNTTEYTALCPAHDDHDPSLVIIHDPQSTEYPVRCHCRSRRDDCTFQNIVSILKERALQAVEDEQESEMTPPFAPTQQIPPPTSFYEATEYSPVYHLAGYCGVSYAWLKDHPQLILSENVTTGWVYFVFTGAPGERPGDVAKGRKMPPTPGVEKKEVGWHNNRIPVPPLWPVPPHELPAEIAITEGETDTILARYWGFEAYTITAGGGAPCDGTIMAELALRGVKKALIFSDLDSPGARCRNDLVRLCQDTGIEPVPVNLRLLADPLLGGYKDLRDYRHLFPGEEGREKAHEAIRGVIQRSAEQVDRIIPAFEDAYAERTQEEDWLVEDVLAPGCISMIAAKPGAGKSTIIFAYAAAAREGGTVLTWPVHPHRILFATEEGTRSLWKKRDVFGSMPHVRLHSVDFEGLDEVSWSEQVRIMGDVARRHGCHVIVIDTLFSYAEPEDEDKSAKVRPVFKRLRSLTRQGFAVLVTMHARKAAGTGVDVVAGSIAIPGEVDVALEVGPADDGEPTHRKVSWIKNRLNPDAVGQPAMTITVEGDHLVLLDDGSGLQNIEQRITTVLGDGQWRTSTDIGTAVGLTQDQLRRPLEELCRHSVLDKERCDGQNGRRNTYRYRMPAPLDLSGLRVR